MDELKPVPYPESKDPLKLLGELKSERPDEGRGKYIPLRDVGTEFAGGLPTSDLYWSVRGLGGDFNQYHSVIFWYSKIPRRPDEKWIALDMRAERRILPFHHPWQRNAVPLTGPFYILLTGVTKNRDGSDDDVDMGAWASVTTTYERGWHVKIDWNDVYPPVPPEEGKVPRIRVEFVVHTGPRID